MKITLTPFVFLSILLVIFVGCADHNEPKKTTESSPTKFGYGGTNNDTAFVTAEGTATNAIATTEIPQPSTATTNAPANPFLSPAPKPATVSHDIPYGTPVPGKPGFVTSPFAPSNQYVDVRGFPPGMEVKDPYSGKVFLVP